MAYNVLSISSYDRITNYDSVSSEIDGVLIRAGSRELDNENPLVTDPGLEEHYKGFKGKTKIGFFWETQASNEKEAEKEAEYINKLLYDNNYITDFPIYIVSNSVNDKTQYIKKEDRTRYLITLCDKIIDYGYNAGVYTTENWCNEKLVYDNIRYKKYSIILIDHFSKPIESIYYDGWEYTNSGNLPSRQDNTSMIYFYKNVANWDEQKININDLEYRLSKSTFIYSGEPNVTEVTVIDGLDTLVEGQHYTLEYIDNIDAGTGTIVVSAIKGDKYYGTKDLYIAITPITIDYAGEVTCGEPNPSGIYDLNNLEVSIADFVLIPEKDYTVDKEDYEDGIYINSDLTIIGKGNYSGTLNKTYRTGSLKEKDINFLNIIITPDSFIYCGLERTLDIRIRDEEYLLVEGTDYKTTYTNNLYPGTAICEIEGIGETYYGTITKKFTIEKIDISRDAILSCGSPDKKGNYNLRNITVSFDNKILREESDYDYSTIVNREGYAYITSVVVYGKGNYKGTVGKKFKTGDIKIPIERANIELERTEYIYNREIIKPELVIGPDLEEGVDFTVSYPSPDSVGNYSVKITGIDRYEGTRELPFTIKPKTILEDDIDFGEPSEGYIYDLNKLVVKDGEIILKKVLEYECKTEELEVFKDTVSCKCTVYGVGNYDGSYIKNVTISKKDIYSGKKVRLDKVPVYTRYCSTLSLDTRTGYYYIWDNNIKENKVRITNKFDYVGKNGFVVGWVDIKDLEEKDIIMTGDQVLVDGIINTYADGSGNSISRRNVVMTVVDKLDEKAYPYCYGVASAINRNRLGWAKPDMLTKIKDEINE